MEALMSLVRSSSSSMVLDDDASKKSVEEDSSSGEPAVVTESSASSSDQDSDKPLKQEEPETTTTTTTTSPAPPETSSSGDAGPPQEAAPTTTTPPAPSEAPRPVIDPRARARELLLRAITRNPSALETAPAEVQRNEAFVLAAIAENATVLEYASALRDRKAFVVQAVAVNGRALWHAPMYLQKDADVIVAAVAKHGADYMRAKRDDLEQPAMDYYLRVMRSSRSAVEEIRNELEHAADEAAEAFTKREDALEAEVAALRAKTRCLEAQLKCTKKSKVVDVALCTASVEPALKKLRVGGGDADSCDMMDASACESYCQSALEIQVLHANNLKAKVDELATLARAAGVDAVKVNAIVDRSLKVTA